jgi:hypothetical protein
MFEDGIQSISFTNWNLAVDLSNQTHKKRETTNAAIEKNKAVYLIVLKEFAGVNRIETAPNSGSSRIYSKILSVESI